MIEQDLENPRLWEIPSPLLKGFRVPFSIYDPTFHKRKITKDPAFLDPCCSSCREPSEVVVLCVYTEDESYQSTLDEVLQKTDLIEAALKTKLLAIQQRMLQHHFEDNLPGMKAWQKRWEFILSTLDGPPEEAISSMYKLTGLVIRHSLPENEWAVGYQFQTAWDMDHGLEIVMCGDRVLTSGGMMELTSTEGSVFEKARINQTYEQDPGDFVLPAQSPPDPDA